MKLLPTFDQLEEYLQLRGWERTRSAFELNEYAAPNQEHRGLTVVVPSHDSIRTGERYIREAVDVLAALEERTRDDMAYTIAYPYADVLQPTLPDIPASVGAIPVFAVESLLDGLRGAIAAGVMMEEGAKLSFDKSSKRSLRVAKLCQLGHSEPGSFRFRLLVPMTVSSSERRFFAAADPIERRAVSRIARFLAAVPQLNALNFENSASTLMQSEVSAKLAESIQRTVDAMPGKVLSLGIGWSPLILPPVDLPTVAPVRIEGSVGKILTRYANEIRQSSPIVNYTVEGKVMTLRKDFNRDTYDAGPDERMVAVFERSTGRQIRLVTSADVFGRLCDALKEEDIVIATGDLVRIGKMYALSPIRSLRLFGRGDEGVLISSAS